MKLSTKKRIYIAASIIVLAGCIAACWIYRKNRSVHSLLMQTAGLVDVNPRQALGDIEQINRRFLFGENYILCDLLKAGALIRLHEYAPADSLLNFVSPYFKYKGDSLWLAQSYYYKGEIARKSNFLFAAVEYYTLCIQYGNNMSHLRELHYYLNTFKGEVYHIKRMNEEEKEARLTVLKLARELDNPLLIQKAYLGLAGYYAGVDSCRESLPVLREAAGMGYSGPVQAKLLFLLSEQYADSHRSDSALIYARQIPRLYQDSTDYLLGKIYFNLGRMDAARAYLHKSCRSNNPVLCLKSYRQLLDLNVHTKNMKGVSDCLEKMAVYEKQVDSLEDKEMFAWMEDAELVRKNIRDTEAEEVTYYKYWVFYFWIMVGAFVCIVILLLATVILQKKKRNLQLKRQQARLDALKMQIDPHFIFNNLSILLDLVETEDKAAVGYVNALSKVYRYIVSNVDNNLSSVEKELSSLDNYIFLLKIRFNNAIQVEIQVEEAMKKRQIPPIVLQMMLENAIKHNRASEESPLFIRIYSERDKLVVENSRKPIASSVSTYRIGLRNVKERYLLIGAPAPEIYEDENIYRITLSTL